MLNQVVLVGRITKLEELKKENDKTFTVITLAVPRSYKNAEGIYDTDFISCILWDNVAKSTLEYCNKGDIVGVRGRLQTKTIEENRTALELIAEKITFLSSKRKENEE